jgi:hypothetical protein
MGAESDLINNPPLFVENRRRPCCGCCGGNCATGIISGGGMLVQNDPIGMQRASDGTSNVMILGETSTFAFTDPVLKTGKARVDQGYPHGWMMGTNSTSVIRDASITSLNERPFNLTTIRYQPGTRAYNLPGVCENKGPNNPLISEHPGGVMILLTDGSAHFLSNTIDLITVKRLATRDDGQTIGNF